MNDSYYRDPRLAERYDHDIDLSHGVVIDDIPFYVGLAKESAARGLPVLELGCGTGRVTIPIAQAGARVTGLDASPAMLDVARRKAAGIDDLSWVEADMADFRLTERFGLVIIPFRSFLLLLTVEDQKSCLRCVREHLVEGGRLALNFFNPDLTIIANVLTKRRNALRRVDGGESSGLAVRRWEKTTYRTAEQSLDWTQRFEELSDQGAIIARVERNLRLRYIFRFEMEHLLALSGFEVDALYGWFDGRAFDETSSEMVWIARRVS